AISATVDGWFRYPVVKFCCGQDLWVIDIFDKKDKALINTNVEIHVCMPSVGFQDLLPDLHIQAWFLDRELSLDYFLGNLLIAAAKQTKVHIYVYI
ncbi:hypothetical protein ACJX0J_019837, partial [Zea mays]